MYIWRICFSILVLLLHSGMAAAQARTSETAFGVMPSPGVHTGLVVAAGYGQNSSVDSYKADNPWALPPLQQVPSFPRYFDSQKDTSIPDAPATGGYSQPSAPGSAGQSGAAPQSYTPYGNGAANSESKPRYWFQQQPRFVTPEILDSIKEQQMRMQKTPTPWQQYSAPRNPRGTDARPLYRRYPAWSSSLSMPTTPDALRDETLLYRGDVLSSIPDAALGGLAPLNVFETLPPELSDDSGLSTGVNNGFINNPVRTFDPYSFGPFGDFIQ